MEEIAYIIAEGESRLAFDLFPNSTTDTEVIKKAAKEYATIVSGRSVTGWSTQLIFNQNKRCRPGIRFEMVDPDVEDLNKVLGFRWSQMEEIRKKIKTVSDLERRNLKRNLQMISDEASKIKEIAQGQLGDGWQLICKTADAIQEEIKK